MTTFYLIRHGHTDALGSFLAGRMPGVPLSPRGRAQAEALAEGLADAPIGQIYASPLERTQETAWPLAARLEIAVQTADELIELDFGAWTGWSMAALENDRRWRLFNTFRSGTRIPGGELIAEVQARAVGFIERLRAEHAGATLALVSHGDVIRAALTHYLGMPLDFIPRIEISPASVSIVTIEDHGPTVLAMNRVCGA